MVRIYSLLMIVCCFCSCQESDKERFTRLVKEWERKQIHFPDHSVFTIQGKDTVDFDFRDADYKVVTYVDSAGCTGCKLQLHRWKELMAEVDSLTDGKVSFLFYFHPKDIKSCDILPEKMALLIRFVSMERTILTV